MGMCMYMCVVSSVSEGVVVRSDGHVGPVLHVDRGSTDPMILLYVGSVIVVSDVARDRDAACRL